MEIMASSDDLLTVLCSATKSRSNSPSTHCRRVSDFTSPVTVKLKALPSFMRMDHGHRRVQSMEDVIAPHGIAGMCFDFTSAKNPMEREPLQQDSEVLVPSFPHKKEFISTGNKPVRAFPVGDSENSDISRLVTKSRRYVAEILGRKTPSCLVHIQGINLLPLACDLLTGAPATQQELDWYFQFLSLRQSLLPRPRVYVASLDLSTRLFHSGKCARSDDCDLFDCGKWLFPLFAGNWVLVEFDAYRSALTVWDPKGGYRYCEDIAIALQHFLETELTRCHALGVESTRWRDIRWTGVKDSIRSEDDALAVCLIARRFTLDEEIEIQVGREQFIEDLALFALIDSRIV